MKVTHKKRNLNLKIVVIALFVVGMILLTGCQGMTSNPDSETPLSDYLGDFFGDRSVTTQIIILTTILSILPSILIMLTCFTRIVIVLGIIRNAMGTQQMPPNQVIVGLSIFLTFFVMADVFTEINDTALQPYLRDEITTQEAVDGIIVPIKEFMLNQTFNDDLAAFAEMGNRTDLLDDISNKSFNDVPMTIIIPAFMTSEIKNAFTMGFLIYLPFLVIDMIVASVLMAMGMMMLPPHSVSMPFKLLVFVLVDYWTQVISSLVGSYFKI